MMDLQTVRTGSGGRWPLPKLTTLVCFALACGMLIGSLLSTADATPEDQAVATRSRKDPNLPLPPLLRSPP